MLVAHFIFWEGLKVFSLVFLALLAVKIIRSMSFGGVQTGRRGPLIKGALYLLVFVIAAAGARVAGDDAAAELYYQAAQRDSSRNQVVLAYSNALRAVGLRPGEIRYWRALLESKIQGQQYASALADEPAIRRLSGGVLSVEDEQRFAACHYALGQYKQALDGTGRIIRQNHFYGGAYLLEGMSYIALQQYGEAEASLLTLLGYFPTDETGVSELAQAYYLSGDTARAMAVLGATNKYSFSPAQRRHFDDLKGLYAQR
ncbi:MAG: hypothetical protein KGM47_02175 [Acidobacteriota bacterium]|nr:hypothetical protein [Acidobacteriota bacterium]